MRILGFPVVYQPHPEHTHLAEHRDGGLAAIVGRDHSDGTADLMVFVPNKAPHWQEAVPRGMGPHTWDHPGAPFLSERAAQDEPASLDGAAG